MEPGKEKELKETVPYLPICPHLQPSGGAHRAEKKGEGFVCSPSSPISEHPGRQKVFLCACSSDQHQSCLRDLGNRGPSPGCP